MCGTRRHNAAQHYTSRILRHSPRSGPIGVDASRDQRHGDVVDGECAGTDGDTQMAQPPKTPAQVAAFDAMKAAESRFRTERTDEAKAAYHAANAAYNAAMPKDGRKFRKNRAQKLQAAMTQEAEVRSVMARSWRR